jgi:hypothetical protein
MSVILYVLINVDRFTYTFSFIQVEKQTGVAKTFWSTFLWHLAVKTACLHIFFIASVSGIFWLQMCNSTIKVRMPGIAGGAMTCWTLGRSSGIGSITHDSNETIHCQKRRIRLDPPPPTVPLLKGPETVFSVWNVSAMIKWHKKINGKQDSFYRTYFQYIFYV